MKKIKIDLTSDTPYALTCRMTVSIICMGVLMALVMLLIPICRAKEFLGLLLGIILSVFLIVSSYFTVKASVEDNMKRPVAYTRSWMLGRYLFCALTVAAATYFDMINPIMACAALLTYNISAYVQRLVLIIAKRGKGRLWS